MKTKLKFTSIMMVALLVISIGIDVYAKVIEGYHQVTAIGGENDTNTINEKDGVKVSKTIAETELENYFDITLKVNTTSKIEEILKDQDLAIVIVMDISNTMRKKDVTTSNGDKTSRFLAAQNAASNFILKFAEYSNNVNASRNIGFVTFNTSAQQIFELKECKTNEVAETLKNDMISKTNEIINANGYAESPTRFTNIEAGLKRASDMLETTTIKNKYIIFLSDGFPTTYIKEGYTGYNPYMNPDDNSDFVVVDENDTTNYGYTESSDEGIFFNELANKLSKDATSYSDEGARKASTIANTIKNNNIKIFSVGIAISDESTINPDSYVTDVDKEKYEAKGNFEIGSNGEQYKAWLRDVIGSGYYYDTNNTEALEAAYKAIFDKVKEMTEQSAQATWVAEDPMEGNESKISNIEFVGLYDDSNSKDSLHDTINIETDGQSDTATYSEQGKKIVWDLKKSSYETRIEGNTTHYIYEIKYRIRLQNELNTFNLEKIYETNGRTTLTYVIRTDGILSDNKYIDFPIPSVIGYLGNLTFTKKSSQDNSNLSGAKFKLVHDTNCKCHQEKKYATIEDAYAISNEQGTITFTNIPSGHIYKLIEITAPTDYILSDTVYNVNVSYGETTGIPSTNIITNDIKKANLEIKKIVEGNNQNSGTFKFNLELWFKGNKLTGNYNYKINNNEIKVINIGTDLIELNNNDTIIIYNLPVGTTYKITETTIEGYEVQYELNSSDRKKGNTVICNDENSCRLEEGSTNKVKFINIGGYLLPATGSSGMLILLIIGSLLLIVPIIYIGYINIKHLRKVS